MKRKLKRSFVKITMISAILVLVLLMGIVNLVSALGRRAEDMEILQYLADNGGAFPMAVKGEKREPDGGPDGEFPGEKFLRKGPHMTAETPYETRYFTVLMDEEGQAVSVDTSRIAAISGDEAAEIACGLLSAGKTSGRYGNFRFTTASCDDGTLYIFLDCSKNISSTRSFLLNSAIVTAIGLAVLFVIAWLLAGWAIRPIVESYEKQKSFITNAGHELKTPLAIIASSTEVIEIEHGESQWTRSIHGQVERLSGLTQDLVSLARMDEGTQQIELTDLDVSEIISQSLEPYAMMADQKGIGFTMELASGIRHRANADALEKICGILADNALKYTADGGEIHFSLSREGSHVVLREENPANALTPGKQEKLFDRFYRGDASRSSAKPGYGLGLPLARSLAEAMGGKMYAESPDGKKLRVIVQL